MPISLVVVDNLLTDPEPLRQAALNATYQDSQVETTYPGRNSTQSQVIPGWEQMMSQLAGVHLTPAMENGGYGKFRVALDGDKGSKSVHIDDADYTAILYLTLPEHCQDGTHFFEHLPSKTDRAPETDEELRAMGCNSPQEFWDKIMHPHSNDQTKWKKIMSVPMRYNRLVLVRANQWHDAGKSFGTSVENGRLIYLTGFRMAGTTQPA